MTWTVQNAKENFDDLLDACLSEKAQIVTREGSEVAVLVAIEDWQRLNSEPTSTLKDLLLSDTHKFDSLPIPPRNREEVKRRTIPSFE